MYNNAKCMLISLRNNRTRWENRDLNVSYRSKKLFKHFGLIKLIVAVCRCFKRSVRTLLYLYEIVIKTQFYDGRD